jgi:hypothetical protein
MVLEWCGVGEFCEGSRHGRAPILLSASRQDDFAEPPADASRLDFNDIPFVMPANDNWIKDSLSARCGSLLRRLLALHSLGGPN